MKIIPCLFTGSDCYKAGRTMAPKGVMVHSTGANNPNLRRYVQPDDGALGKNTGNNHWNQSGVDACVHAFIGKLADGTVGVYQTLPWTCRGWHAGGAANNTHISFEICEDGLTDGDYFRKVYQAAVELTAYLCRMYQMDPAADGVVICHSEGYQRGIASNHADVMHWFPRHGKDMDDFRADVERAMNTDTQGGEDEMTQEQFDAMLEDYQRRHALPVPDSTPAGWEAGGVKWATENGLMAGDGSGDLMLHAPLTRAQFCVMLQRYHQKKNKMTG